MELFDREGVGGIGARAERHVPEQVVSDLAEGVGVEPAFGGEAEGVVVGLGGGWRVIWWRRDFRWRIWVGRMLF